MKTRILEAFAFISALLFGFFQFEKRQSAEALLDNVAVKQQDVKLQEEQAQNTAVANAEEAKVDEVKQEEQSAETQAANEDKNAALNFWNKKE